MTNESVECPLCMEPMDFDDVDFYPCPCRYQICRFCWDKIINEENGLCPACRKPYNSEHPASYKPRTDEEIKNKIKHSKKVCIKKTKPVPEGKEYLSEYRVLQKNLIFVVGLPMRMAEEVELLKGLEYFGKCGKVYKIVINQNQTFPGPQGTPCLSAYVTYHRNEDALKTLVDLKKLEIDGRAVKLSLGTTKYCSQFLRNRRCTKQDCMYLHEMGDHAASFTKEDMANGKHTEYENQLIQEFFENQKLVVSSSPSPSSVLNGTSIPLANLEQEKPVARKSSLSNSQPPGCVSCIPSSPVSVTSLVKSQRTGYSNCQITPIGTDPNDATKIYSVSSDGCHSSKPILSKITSADPYTVGNDSQSTLLTSESIDNSGQTSDLQQQYLQQTSQSLLDSFYFLNSQATTSNNNNNISSSTGISHPYEQQVNNNGLTNFTYKTETDLNRSFGNDRYNNVDHQYKDNADIDFDPINISRLGLAELIANENRQKMTSYAPQMYGARSRGSGHEFLMQQNQDFFSNSSNSGVSGNNHSHRMQPLSSSMNAIGSANCPLPVTIAPIISSGYPSPPPGFEVSHSCIGGEQPTNEIMSMIMATGGDLYSRYQNQHSNSDIPTGINHHSSNYGNQYSIPPSNNYHSDFSPGYPNGSMLGYSDLPPSQSHPWKTAAQSMFCDGPQEVAPHARPSAGSSSVSSVAGGGGGSGAVSYHRSQSMNENTGSTSFMSSSVVNGAASPGRTVAAGIRNGDWNGYASYNSTNDSQHMSNYPFY